MAELFSGNVEVQYGQAYIELDGCFDGVMEDCFRGQSNGICGAAAPANLFLITGLHTGPVGLTIALFEADPGIDPSWDEIVEVSFEAPRGEITLVEWGADDGPAFPVPPGSYRGRYQARAMQQGNELDTNIDDAPVDFYRLDIWPAPAAPDCIVKQSSQIAGYWHDWAHNLARSG